MSKENMIKKLLDDLDTLIRFKDVTDPVETAKVRANTVRALCDLGYEWEKE